MFDNKWIAFPKERPDAKLRLFCFPYAGSGASVYNKWPENVLPEIEICAVKLPGHESRFIEEPYRRINKLIEDLASGIFPLLNKPFIFFGHSIGAHISFHLARYLRQNCMPYPIHMFVSGSRAPHLPDKPDSLHYQMDDDLFIKKLKELGGMAEEILQNNELMDLILPVLRADVEILNTIEYFEEEPLDCDISSFGGLFDPRVTMEDSEAWNIHTHGDFNLTMVPGKHLFINTHREQIIDLVNKDASVCLKKLSVSGSLYKAQCY